MLMQCARKGVGFSLLKWFCMIFHGHPMSEILPGGNQEWGSLPPIVFYSIFAVFRYDVFFLREKYVRWCGSIKILFFILAGSLIYTSFAFEVYIYIFRSGSAPRVCVSRARFWLCSGQGRQRCVFLVYIRDPENVIGYHFAFWSE